jgi:hypothetical protein
LGAEQRESEPEASEQISHVNFSSIIGYRNCTMYSTIRGAANSAALIFNWCVAN